MFAIATLINNIIRIIESSIPVILVVLGILMIVQIYILYAYSNGGFSKFILCSTILICLLTGFFLAKFKYFSNGILPRIGTTKDIKSK
jgi:hypothetical protein